eukprot:1480258-Prymnesium_polylepis.1
MGSKWSSVRAAAKTQSVEDQSRTTMRRLQQQVHSFETLAYNETVGSSRYAYDETSRALYSAAAG